MAPEIFTELLSAFIDRRPFRPFTVVLVSGDRVQIDHPKALAIRGGAGFFWGPGSVPVIFDNEGVSQIVGELMEQPNGAV